MLDGEFDVVCGVLWVLEVCFDCVVYFWVI